MFRTKRKGYKKNGAIVLHRLVMMKLFSDVQRKDLVFYVGISIVYLLIAMAMLWPITTDITGRVLGLGGDPYQALWNIWWDGYSTFVLHSSVYFSSYIFYPIGASLITQDLAPFAGWLSIPFQWISLTLALNVITLVGFMLSGLFMYFLAHRFTGNKYASFVAGFVYTFSAWHFAQAGGHLDFINIEFIPLFLLLFFDMVEKSKKRHAVYAAIAFLFVTFAGGLDQALMTILLVVTVIAYLLLTDRKKVLNVRFATLFAAMVIMVFVAGIWAFLPMINGIRSGVIGVVNAQATTPYNELYSLDLASYFLPSFTNGIFSGIWPAYYAIYAPDPGERPAYLGYTVIILMLIAVIVDYKQTKVLKQTGLWVVILLFFGWMSIGPYLQVLGTLTSIPGIYILYHAIPIFNVIREPGRFDLLVTLAAAMLAAIGLDTAMKSNKIDNKAALFGIVVVFLLIEYWGGPISGSAIGTVASSTAMPRAYPQIGNATGNFSVLILPSLPNATAPDMYPGLEMYYQTAFKKPLVGGYATRSNFSQEQAVSVIPLSVEGALLEEGAGFGYPSPIIENYSNLTAFFLWTDQVNYVAVVRPAYTLEQQEILLSNLSGWFGQPVYQDNTTTVFDAVPRIKASAGKTLVAYTWGEWEPGLALCGSSSACSNEFINTWWGSDPRTILLYSPNATDNETMHLQAYAPTQVDLYVYQNGQPIDELPLLTTPENFSVPLKLQAGLSELDFYVSNSTYEGSGVPSIEYFGIKNVTFKS